MTTLTAEEPATTTVKTDDTAAELTTQPLAAPVRRGWYRRLGAVLAVPLWMIVVASVACLSLAWAWRFDPDATSRPVRLLQSGLFYVRVFQFAMALGLVACAGLALVLLRWRLLIVALLAAGPWLALEVARAVPAEPVAANGPKIRLASMNVYAFNDDTEAILAAARELDADVLLMQEFNTSSGGRSRELEALREMYPYVVSPRDFSKITGMRAVFSRYPVELAADHANVGQSDNRRRVEVILPSGHRLAVYSVHHSSPGMPSTVMGNMQQARSLVASLPAEQMPAVWAGDFNASTWTPQLSWLRGAGLTEAFDAAGTGRGATWPFGNQLGDAKYLPSVRIDNIFMNKGVTALASGVGPFTGSDHRPVWADLQLVD